MMELPMLRKDDEESWMILQKEVEKWKRLNSLASTLQKCSSNGPFPLELYQKESKIGRGSYGDVCTYTFKDKDKIVQIVRMKLQEMGCDTTDLIDSEMQQIFNEAGFDSKVAVKKLIPQSDSDEGEMRRMKREEENLKKLKHPFIVEMYGSLWMSDGLAGQTLFLVMEACDGNLRKLCNSKLRRQLDESEILWIILQILHGLDFMHSHNIMHRDLKPENVLLKRSYNFQHFSNWETVSINDLKVKICDFGFSRLVSSTSGAQSLSPMMGTHGYMAPEVLEGGNYHKKADVFSVGVITFELEHKRRPTKEEYKAVKNGHRVSKYGWMGDWMLRMLQRDAKKRPTAKEASDPFRPLPFPRTSCVIT